MICEKILGKLTDGVFSGKKVDYVDIHWDEAFKKLHRKTSQGGTELGIRLDDSVLTRGLNQDDVLAVEGDTVYAVNIPPCRGDRSHCRRTSSTYGGKGVLRNRKPSCTTVLGCERGNFHHTI